MGWSRGVERTHHTTRVVANVLIEFEAIPSWSTPFDD
jgi:hypothetical protein